MSAAAEVTFPSEIFPTVAQVVCPCGWTGPCRDVSSEGPRRFTELELRRHMRRHHEPTWEPPA